MKIGQWKDKVRAYHKLLAEGPPSTSYKALILRRDPNPPFRSYMTVLGMKVSVPSAPIPGLKWTSWSTGDSSSAPYVKYDSYSFLLVFIEVNTCIYKRFKSIRLPVCSRNEFPSSCSAARAAT